MEKTEYAPTKVDYVRSYLPVPEMEPEAIRKAAELINGAERPLVLVGQGVEWEKPSKSFVLSLRSRNACRMHFIGTFRITYEPSVEQRNAWYAR